MHSLLYQPILFGFIISFIGSLCAHQDPWQHLDSLGRTELHRAVKTNNYRVVEELLRVYSKNKKFLNHADLFEYTALDYARQMYSEDSGAAAYLENILWEAGCRPAP